MVSATAPRAKTLKTNIPQRRISCAGEYEALKGEAAALAKAGDYMRAYCNYSLCIADERFAVMDDDLAFTLTNRSLMSLKLGDYDAALRDGLGAIEMVRCWPTTANATRRSRAMAKALYRVGCARMGLMENESAIDTFNKALLIAPGDEAVRERLVECVKSVRMSYICDAYADAISDGEMPNKVSPRDGKWLKPVKPETLRVSRNAMAQTLLDCVVGHEADWRREFIDVYLAAKTNPKALSNMRRGFLSGIRACVYAHIGNHAQAVKDYQVALAYYPDWARAYFGYAQSIEHELILNNVTRVEVASISKRNGVFDNLIVDAQVAAALWTKKALEFDESNDVYALEYHRLAEKVSDAIREALTKGASAALEYLDKEKWQNAPEYIRPRPKYYYFYEMMKERIYEHFPELPQPVMDKLLSLDAGELDLLLQYPRAIKGQTEEFLDVYKREGGEYLLTYKTPQLSWDEVKALKGKGTQGLLPGGADSQQFGATADECQDPGSGFALEKDTNHAMIGASGDDGLTREEFLGAPAPPKLPPDQLRDAINRLGPAPSREQSPNAHPIRELPNVSRAARVLAATAEAPPGDAAP
jgi:tetratricopeptide (TPR) repeat protein